MDSSLFFPIKTGYKDVYVNISYDKKLIRPAHIHGKSSFLTIKDDENTVNQFLYALKQWKYEDAKAYLSKNYSKDFDLKELSLFFVNKEKYKSLITFEFEKKPKNCKTSSILVMNSDKKCQEIIHLHMIKEPDIFSKWKIYSIEKE